MTSESDLGTKGAQRSAASAITILLTPAEAARIA
jgi:hypothetical protein